MDTRRETDMLPGPSQGALMKPRALSLAVAFALFGLSSTALADIEIRQGGSSWAKVENDGTIRINGSSVGKIESDGTVRKNGSSVGQVENDGTIRKSGSSVGKIESDGTLRKNGSSIGQIESGGTIRKSGSSWGSASNCCGDHGSKRTVAAVLVFFSDFF
jgi:hypothetical protein